ncbi:cytochrome P450 family protein [Amycolatopsis keratiniphila]|uniref:Peroxidase n=1 Tax=Amycolatopsis keratiniphila TaxID=129921 RepID=R4TB82_9PSEU|nr:cytochrome P450 [Amycolatopsis keratiniphila]AGM08087.1 peroxidase [Amycolatopsis keratiniphila]
MDDLSTARTVQERRCPVGTSLHSKLRTPEFAANPFDLLGELRESGPVHRCEPPGAAPIWLITRHAEGAAALTDPRLVKDPTAVGLPAGWQPGTETSQLWSKDLAGNDPPNHTRLRKLVARPFTKRRVEAMRPGIEKAARELRETMVRHETFDLVTEFAGGLTTATICDLLGIPAADRDTFQGWADTFFTVTVPGQADNDLFVSITKYFARLIARKRDDPQDDLLSALIKDTGNDKLDGHELISMASSLLLTGHEPAVRLIGNILFSLLRRPELVRELREDPSLIPATIREIIRFDSPALTSLVRFAAEDIEMGDVVIRRGDAVLVSLLSANRDPARFEQADEFLPARDTAGHLGFGLGIHFCIGAQLAQLEAEVAVRELLPLLPELSLAVPESELPYHPGLQMYGVQSLPVRLHRT